MAIAETLWQQNDLLAKLYDDNFEATRRLQTTLLEEILPGVVDELGLDEEGEERARSWLSDFGSMFRLLKRHKFTFSFALEHARDVLLWRLAVFPTDAPQLPERFLYCLPSTARDPLGRPIIVLKVASLLKPTVDARAALIHHLELLRLHLAAVNAEERGRHRGRAAPPVLQFVALLDIAGLSVQSVQNIDLLSWYLLELQPRFPGMLAAVFILNYSWAHTSLWNIAKRTLPKSALSRVFFPSQTELLQVFSPRSIPSEFGGELPSADFARILDAHCETSLTSPPPQQPSSVPVPVSSPPPSADTHVRRIPSIAPTSHLNPYFGYPVSRHDAMTHRLRHGRRRKRDLVRTLALLWWGRWKRHALLVLGLILAGLVLLTRRRLASQLKRGGRLG